MLKGQPGRRVMVMGDINCDMSRANEDSAAWLEAQEAAGVELLDRRGAWAEVPTRIPLGQQGGSPSHIY